MSAAPVGIFSGVGPLLEEAVIGIDVAGLRARVAAILVALTALLIPLSTQAVAWFGHTAVPIASLVGLAALVVLAVQLWPQRRDLERPVLVGLGWVAPYVVVGAIVTVAAGASLHPWVGRTATLVEFVLFGLLVWSAGLVRWLLPQVALCTVMAAIWIFRPGDAYLFNVQKNNAGTQIAIAFLVVMLVRLTWWQRTVLGSVLACGLLATGSRGSVLALLVASLVLVAFPGQLKRLWSSGLVIGALAAAYYIVIPTGDSQRLTGGAGQSTISIRHEFARDAMAQWHAHPWGVGVGAYVPRNAYLEQVAHDPHDAYLLALVEGGIPLLLAFGLLVIAPLWLGFRSRDRWAGLLVLTAAIATFGHVAVDVFWNNGTPMPVLILLGVGAALAAGERVSPATAGPPERASVRRTPAH